MGLDVYIHVDGEEVYSSGITHNLTNMADEADLYQYLWRPEELSIKTANQLIEPLRIGLHTLKSEPNRFKPFNPYNGWGSYDDLVKFVIGYLDACYKYPDGQISVCR
jgi:hypothetical protein